MKNYITCDILAKQIDRYTILDCRGFVHDDGMGRQAYEEGHIPGAQFIPGDWMSAEPRVHGGRHPLPDMEQFAARLGSIGVTKDADIVVYDRGIDLGMVGRLWWMLRYMGASSVKILMGGYDAWAKANLPITSEEIEVEPKVFNMDLQDELYVDRDEILRIIEVGDKVLVDAREGGRYRGEYEPLDPRPGHIPGALNLFYQDLFIDGRVCDWATLEKLVAEIKATEKEVVMYCGSGVSAPMALSVIEDVGIKPVLYVGSMSDWQSWTGAELSIIE